MGFIMRYRAAGMFRDGLTARLQRWLVVCAAVLAFASPAVLCRAQENPLGNVTTPVPPPPPKSPDELKPVVEGGENVAIHGTTRHDARLRIDVNLVQVPLPVTDPMNRLVTGLEKDNFVLYDNNRS